MAGSKIGGLKAAIKNKEKYGFDFYRRIGALGGKKSRGGGFAYDTEMARLAGRLGGLKSRRGDATPVDNDAVESAKQQIKLHRR
jgi:general stress protein YciG